MLLNLPLLGGVDNSTEPTISSKPTVMENCWYSKVSGVQRRFGITKQTTGTNVAGSTSVYTTGSFQAGPNKGVDVQYGGLAVLGEAFWGKGYPLSLTANKNEIVLHTSALVLSYVTSRPSWSYANLNLPISTQVESGADGISGSVAVANNRIAHAFIQITNTAARAYTYKVFARVLDATSREPIADRTLLYEVTSPSIAINVRVIRLGSDFLFVYGTGSGTLNRQAYSTTTDSFGSASTYATWASITDFEVDADRSGYTQYAIIATGANTDIIKYSSSHVASAALTLSTNPVQHKGLSLWYYNSGIWAAGWDSGTTTTTLWRISNTPTLLATSTRSSTGARTVVQLLDQNVYAYDDVLLLWTDGTNVKYDWFSYSSGGGGTISSILGTHTQYNSRIISYPITQKIDGTVSGKNYYNFVAINDVSSAASGTVGSSLVLAPDIDYPTNVLTVPKLVMAASVAPQESYTQVSDLTTPPSRAEAVDSSNFVYSDTTSNAFGGVDTFDGGFNEHIVNCKVENSSGAVITATPFGLAVPGGAMRLFDGANSVDFNIYTKPAFTVSATAGGAMSVGSFSVAVVHRHWIDGQERFSIPAVTTATTTSVNKTLTLTINTVQLSDSDWDSNPMMIDIYCSALNQETMYFVKSVINARGSATLTMTIAADPAATSKQLYTTGDVLDNSSPPGGTCSTLHQGRIFLGGTPDDSILYTREYVFGEIPGFNEGLKFQAFEGGKVVALASNDSALVVFKQNGVYAIAGQGPDDKGNNSSYSLPQKVQSDTGCLDRKSVVSTPIGVFFRGRRGIYLLDRSLAVKYVGRPIEDVLTSSITVTDSVYYEKDSQVWFFTNSTSVYVYDLLNDSWSTFIFKKSGGSDLSPRVGCIVGGDLYMVDNSTLNLWKYDRSKYLDEDYYFTDKYRSQFSTQAFANGGLDPQGWYRIRNVYVKGTIIENAGASVTLYYNWDTETSSNRAWTATEASATGDTYNRQYRIVPGLQKCQSIAVEYTSTTPTSPTTGGGIRLQSILLEVEPYNRGVKRRANAQK